MKKKKMFKNRTQMIIYIIIFIVCIILFILIGITDFSDENSADNNKFSSLYSLVSEDNIYTFATASDILNILNGNSGIILLGFPSNEWTNYYAYILNDVAKENNVDKIYYYDFLSDRDESNGTYETIVNKLANYITYDDEGNGELRAPTVVMVKKGEVVAYFSDTSYVEGKLSPESYYTDYQIGLTYELFNAGILEYLGE